MQTMKQHLFRSVISLALAAVMLLSLPVASAAAGSSPNLGAGTYEIESSSLSLYVNAMGGIEFAQGIYQGASVTVDASGNAQLILRFGAGQVTIYSITVDTFVDPTDSAPGYYDGSGSVQEAAYTVSEDTALNPANESVRYVDSMTFPVSVGTGSETYHLWLYVNSNVMGVQFGDGSGSGSSNQPGVSTPYAATLTIDWDSVQGAGGSQSGGAAGEANLGAGTYEIESSSLSLYVNAMGGIEFAQGIYQGASVTVDASGNAQLILRFGAGQVTIYSITVDTFVDPTDSAPGYYDGSGSVQEAAYTVSEDTALNPANESVRYVDSMTFPVSVGTGSETYHLWLYVNSNVMGVQFGDGSGSGSSNQPGVSTPYAATLTIDWSSLQRTGGSIGGTGGMGGTGTPDPQPGDDPSEDPEQGTEDDPALDPTPELGSTPFTDVAEGAYYNEAVTYVYERGLMQGTSETTFGPDVTTTRAQVVTILYRLAGSPAVTGDNPFTDATAGWYADAVVWASQNSIVNGYSDTVFGPEDTITREQLAAILYRYADGAGYDVTASGDLSGFADAGSVSSWSAGALSWANGAGLIQGSNNQVNPQGSAIRAQLAVILMRFVDNVAV